MVPISARPRPPMVTPRVVTAASRISTMRSVDATSPAAIWPMLAVMLTKVEVMPAATAPMAPMPPRNAPIEAVVSDAADAVSRRPAASTR